MYRKMVAQSGDLTSSCRNVAYVSRHVVPFLPTTSLLKLSSKPEHHTRAHNLQLYLCPLVRRPRRPSRSARRNLPGRTYCS